MGKIGIGQLDSDKNVTLRTRGIIDTLVIEIVDSEGNQITSFGAGSGTALGNGQVLCDTTVGGTSILAASAGRAGAIFANHSTTVTVFIGTETVTISNGFSLGPGESVAITTDSEVKGITSSGSATIGFLSLA